jgi:hypothetical protein
MNRLGFLLLNIAVALYLFVNGILGFSDGGEFKRIAGSIFTGDFAKMVTIILSVCAIAGALFLMLQLFKVIVPIPITDLILFIFVIVWAVFVVIVNIINPVSGGFKNFEFLPYAAQLSAHLMVLGALITSTKRFA